MVHSLSFLFSATLLDDQPPGLPGEVVLLTSTGMLLDFGTFFILYVTDGVQLPLSVQASIETSGFALEAAVGKEWFVSDRWGLGLAVGITYHSFPDEIAGENWSGISIPVRFSATFN